MKSKYVCVNCGAKQNRKYIDAMRKAGFAAYHLACKECGMHTIAEHKKGA